MRHSVSGRKLGRTTAHRKAMFRNQLAALVREERIKTTLPKAKELRPLAEKMITRSREDSVHARRQVRKWLVDRDLIKKLFEEISPRFKDRPGGYLRIIKLGPRLGDAAEMALLEFVDSAPEGKAKKSGKKSKAVKKDSKSEG